MLTFRCTVSSDRSAEQVWAYLADFRTVDEWDPRATAVRRVHGDGGVGSEYRCEVHFLRRTAPMVYVVTSLQPSEQIEWEGRSGGPGGFVRTRDVIDVRPRADGGCDVEYRMCVVYRRLGWVLDRVLAPAVSRLCDDARVGLEGALVGSGSQDASR